MLFKLYTNCNLITDAFIDLLNHLERHLSTSNIAKSSNIEIMMASLFANFYQSIFHQRCGVVHNKVALINKDLNVGRCWDLGSLELSHRELIFALDVNIAHL